MPFNDDIYCVLYVCELKLHSRSGCQHFNVRAVITCSLGVLNALVKFQVEFRKSKVLWNAVSNVRISERKDKKIRERVFFVYHFFTNHTC